MKPSLLALLLMSAAWADDRPVVQEVFRRPEFRWKSEETQPPPPVCPPPVHWDLGTPYGGRPDRSGGVAGTSDSNGLIAPDPTPESSQSGQSSDSAISSRNETPSASPLPSESGIPSYSTGSESPSDSNAPSQSGNSSAWPTPPGSGSAAQVETPAAPPLPSETPGSSDLSQAPGDSPTSAPQAESTSTPKPSATAKPELPDHPPPPLDYSEPPGFLERLARAWNKMLGRPSKPGDGVQQILLWVRDLLVLLLLGIFVRHLLPLFRQLRSWFKTDPPPKIAVQDEQAPPEILPEWRHLWLQALSQPQPARAQRLGYLAVLSFLDHTGHIRYRACGTNREYLALFDSQSPLREGFASLTRSFERCRYGGQAPDFNEFQAVCRQILPL